MTSILLVTNDFPPRSGGIQSYLENLVGGLVKTGTHTLTVYAPKWKGCEVFDAEAATDGYEVVRHPTTLMVPEPSVAMRMRRLIASHDVDTVWFGAAAPLALLAPLARDAGASRVIASTHGHEVGWSMLPLARTALRRIGNDTDVVTFISQYTRDRFASAFGPRAALERLSPGVDTDRFEPDSVARAELRARYRLGERPVIAVPFAAGAAQGSGHADPRTSRDPATDRRCRPGDRRGWAVPHHAAPAGAPVRGRRARGVHRRCACRRAARAPRDGRRVRDAMPDQGSGAGRRGPRHRLPRGVGCRRARGGRTVRGRTGVGASTARRDWWSTVGMSAPSRSRSATYLPIPTGPRGWVPQAADGSSRTGSGAPRRSASASS